MNTYRVTYRIKDYPDEGWHFIKADTDEDAAYDALDFAKTHKYNLLDVRRMKFYGQT